VGIGTNAPLGKLHVENSDYGAGSMILTSTAGGAGATIRFTNPAAGNRTFDLIGSTGSAAGTGAGSFGIFDNTNAAYRFVIGPTGNVGIGTISPLSKLQVEAAATTSGQYVGRFINTFAGSADGVAVYGQSTSTATNYGIGVQGVGNYWGVLAQGTAGGNTALRAQANGASSAGVFEGNVNVVGALSKSSGTFKIDHPTDPENKYLYHSFVESPDMMNVYNGNIVTDAQGNATVSLPDYFNALNKDFRYQLTVINQFAQAIISEKVQGNSFMIKTDKPNVEVSWQVTGVRQDPFANANRVIDVVEKTREEKGKYIHPALYGQPASKQIDAPRISTSPDPENK
jgi:hypothetical protein